MKLWNGSLAPATASSPRPADAPSPILEPAAAAGAPAWATLASPPVELPIVSAGEPHGHVPSTASQRHPSDTSPDPLLRTPSSVDSIADDFFENLIRRTEGDR